jgi:hypothetical protein
VEAYSSTLEQVEDRISEFEDKIKIKEEILVKQLKSCEKNMQKPNLRIMGTEGEEVISKEICNIFIIIITENFRKF